MRQILLFGSLLALSAFNNGISQNETAAAGGNTQVTAAGQAAAGPVRHRCFESSVGQNNQR